MDFLKVSNVSISFGNNKVVKDFSYTFRPGVTIVSGRNGVGKSTLLSIIATVTAPDSGEISCCVKGIKQNFNIIRDGCYVPDEPEFYQFMSLKEFFNLVRNMKGLSFNFYDTLLFKEFHLDIHLYTPLHALSLGTKKKAFILVALTACSPVIILDEPTNGLDIISCDALVASVKENVLAGRIVIIASHDKEFTRYFDAENIAL